MSDLIGTIDVMTAVSEFPHYVQLEANEVKTLDLDRDYGVVAVMLVEGEAPLYVRTDGQDPGIMADGSFCVLPGVRRDIEISTNSNSIVKLICAEAAAVEIEV